MKNIYPKRLASIASTVLMVAIANLGYAGLFDNIKNVTEAFQNTKITESPEEEQESSKSGSEAKSSRMAVASSAPKNTNTDNVSTKSSIVLSDNSDVLKKWGVSPKKLPSSTSQVKQRRQPMRDNYKYWLALKYAPDVLSENDLLIQIEEEIKYSINYYEKNQRRDGKPWLSYDEVKGRHPRTAAPDFLGRYRRYLNKFMGNFSGRVVSGFGRVGVPVYDKNDGMMRFAPNTREDKRRITNLASQHTWKPEQAFYEFGEKTLDLLASELGGRRLGEVGRVVDTNQKIIIPAGLVKPKAMTHATWPKVVYLALDRDVEFRGISMSVREAERFLNRFENGGGIRVNIKYTVKDALLITKERETYIHKSIRKNQAIVLIADLEEVTLHGYAKQTDQEIQENIKAGKSSHRVQETFIKKYAASDFPAPKVTFASLKEQYNTEFAKQENKKKASAMAEKQYKEQSTNSLKKEITELKEQCKKTGEPNCYSQLCGKINRAVYKHKLYDDSEAAWCKEQYGIAKLERGREADAKRREEMNQQAKTMGIRQSCSRKYIGDSIQSWMPIQGTPEHNSVVKACIEEPTRAAAGPDILGLKLGMTKADATNYIRRQNVKYSATLSDTRPFEKATLNWTEDASHGIALFTLTNGGSERVAAISRRLYVEEKKISPNQVIDGLQQKYGNPGWANKSETLLWTFSSNSSNSDPKMCSGLVKLVNQRSGWSREWNTAPIGNTKRERRDANQMTRMNAYNECVAKFGTSYGATAGGQPDMAKMLELQNCIKGGGPPGSAGTSNDTRDSPNKNARFPMMITESGSNEVYREYKNCGPVIIAQINNNKEGYASDISVILFDPEWISHQPKVAFGKAENTGGLKF